MTRSEAKVRHYLLSVPITADAHTHGYLMCTDRRFIVEATDRMLKEAERRGFHHYPLMNMVLVTELGQSVETVRDVLRRRCAQAAKLLQEASDYHFSAWLSQVSDPDDSILMDLH